MQIVVNGRAACNLASSTDWQGSSAYLILLGTSEALDGCGTSSGSHAQSLACIASTAACCETIVTVLRRDQCQSTMVKKPSAAAICSVRLVTCCCRCAGQPSADALKGLCAADRWL